MHLAAMLSVEDQDVVLMGSNPERLQELDASHNFLTALGQPTSVRDLEECGAGEADIFVAVTPDDNANIVACEFATQLGAKKCVARVDDPEYSQPEIQAMLRRLGIDMTICPELSVADTIVGFIKENWASEIIMLHKGELMVAGIRVEPGNPLEGKTLRDISSNQDPRYFHVSTIKRGDRVIIPRGDDMIKVGDTLYTSALPDDMVRVRKMFSCEFVKPGNIMITGAGRVTENLLELLRADGSISPSITVIDPDKERCREMACKFPEAVIVTAKSSDIVTMKEEGISNCDVFLALTGSSEANIVACMVAREHGVRKTLARIEQFEYMEEAESLSINKIVNKKQLNASMVINLLLQSNGASTQCLATDKAEVTGITATAGSKIVSKPICELSLPQGITIAGLVRDGKGMLVEGRTHIQPGDRVMVFFLTGSLSKVNKFFR